MKSKPVTVKLSRDFGVWGLAAYNSNGDFVTSYGSNKLMENTYCTFEVNWTNYKNIAQNNVKCEVYLDDTLMAIDYIDFSGGYQTITKTYSKNIGWGIGNRTLKARINFAAKDTETDPYDNERTAVFAVAEYKEFSISNLNVSRNSVYENNTINVTCRTDNWNLLKSYSNIPVELVYNNLVVATEYVDFSAYGVGYHTFTLNVGSSIGTKSLYARLNWNDRTSEVNSSNNQTVVKTVTVSPQIDTGISIITPNSDYRAGTEVITSFEVFNNSRHNLIPANNPVVRFNAYYYNKSGVYISLVDTSKSTVIPAYGNNLVFFKWTIPSDVADKYIYISATMLSDEYDGNTANNYMYTSRFIYPVTISQTPNTKFEKSKPGGWSAVSAPSTQADSAIWSEWSYANGSFIKNTYGIRLSTVSTPIITPDSNSPSAKYINGQWSIKSGYGFSLSLYPSITSISGIAYPSSYAYTAVQRGYALFPEFVYSSSNNNYRTLQLVGGSFQFYINPLANGKRLHYTPIWYPNGSYATSCYLYDFWTPAGMLSARINSNSLIIDGSLYDDWFIGR